MNDSWKTVRIFISSTFKDMQAERDHLVRFVFPRLREELLKRRIHLVDVDLRWGVTSDQDAYDVCMEEIDNCHPRFICILGGRYGWIPPESDISITASEVNYGALDKLDEPVFRYFYFRDPEITSSIPCEYVEDYQEPSGSESEILLESLKEKIMNPETKGKILVHPDVTEYKELPYYIYPCNWDDELKRIVDLELFGNQVYNDIIDSIDAEFGTTSEIPNLNEFEDEKLATEAFIEQKIEHYVVGSRREILNSLKDFVENDHANGYLCIYGDPGSGKTALLAKFYDEYINDSKITDRLIISVFIGSTVRSTNPHQIVRRLCFELSQKVHYDMDIPEDYEELKKLFNSLLNQVSIPIIILIDAINQINNLNQSLDLSWLPDFLPKNVHILISTIHGSALESLRNSRIQPLENYLMPLKSSDTELIIDEFLRRYRKKFDDNQKAALMDKKDSDKPLYISTALEELRTLGTYEEITDRILELPETVQPLFQWILERLEEDNGFRDCNGNLVGSKVVKEFNSLIAVSRYGLSQNELLDLIDPYDPQGNIAALNRLLRPYLMYKDNLINFYHNQFLDAVCNIYLTDNNIENDFRLKLADYFESKKLDDRKLDELPWQLDKANAWDLLKDCITNLDFFMEMMKNREYELIDYWQDIDNKYSMVELYKYSLEHSNISENSKYHPALYYSKIAYFLYLNAYYEDAEPFYQKSLKILEKEFGPENPDTGQALVNLADLMRKKGDFTTAEFLDNRAIEIFEKTLGPNHKYTALALDNLGMALVSQYDFYNAEPLLRRGMKINEKIHGIYHPDTAQSMNNLAELLRMKGDLNEAENLYKKALKIREKTLGPTHPHTAMSLNNFALFFRTKGDLNEAENLYKKALKIYENSLGPEHPDTAAIMLNLAETKQRKGDLNEAENLYKKALEISENSLGPEHPNTAMNLDLFAVLLSSKGDLNEAEKLHRKALKIYENSLDSEHPDIAQCMNRLGILLSSKGDLNEAENLYKKALKIYENSLGTQNPQTATCLNNLGFLLSLKGDLNEAENLYKKALKIREKTLGSKNQLTADSLYCLGHLLNSKGNSKKAIKFYSEALKIYDILPPTNNTALCLNNLGVLLYDKGDLDEAEILYKKSLTIQEKTLAPKHPQTITTRNNLDLLKKRKSNNQNSKSRFKFWK